MSDFVRPTHPAQRGSSTQRLLVRVGVDTGIHGRLDVARRDGVDPYRVRRPFEGESPSQLHDHRLGHRIRTCFASGRACPDAGDVDDARPRPAAQQRAQGVAHVEHAVRVHSAHPCPRPKRVDRADRSPLERTGRIDQDVETGIGSSYPVRERADRLESVTLARGRSDFVVLRGGVVALVIVDTQCAGVWC